MKILLLAHPYHKKTRSNQFFLDELKKRGHKVTVVFYEETGLAYIHNYMMANSNLIRIIKLYDKHEVIIFWQVNPLEFPEPTQRKIFVPMVDAVALKGFDFFYTLKNFEFISFSSNLHNYLKIRGLRSTLIRYFPGPAPRKADKLPKQESIRIFFWERRADSPINLTNLITKLPAELSFEILYRPALDPVEGISESKSWELDPARKNVRLTNLGNKWLSDLEYLEIIQSCSWFIAPRMSEGIGLSFLNALSVGIPVIAQDFPTMSEYIQHGENGILTNFSHPKKFKAAQLLETKIDAIYKLNLEYRKIYQGDLESYNSYFESGNIDEPNNQKIRIKYRLPRFGLSFARLDTPWLAFAITKNPFFGIFFYIKVLSKKIVKFFIHKLVNVLSKILNKL